MKRKRIRTSRYVAALALTMVVFLIGYIVGSQISDAKLQKVYDLENEIRIESLGNELLFEMVQKDCSSINTTAYTEELTGMGKRLTYMESLYGYQAPQVLQLKNHYSLLLVRHWMLTEQLNEECGLDKPTVLYFYTNLGPCADCEDQGLVLTNVHRNYALFNIYSFEYGQRNPALDYLKERYNIQEHRLPTLIINGTVYYGFQSKEFLLQTLDLERRLAESKIAHPEWYE